MAPKTKARSKKPAKSTAKAKKSAPKPKAKAKAKKSAPKPKPKKASAKKASAKNATTKQAKAKAPKTVARSAAATAQRTPGAPKGYRSVTPYLVVEGAAKALEFYAKAFGAKEMMKLCSPDGRICHAEIQIGDSMIMISDDYPEMNGGKSRSPMRLGGTPVSVHIYVPNADRSFDQAVAAGCSALMPLTDMFWGDRFGLVADPYGHMWSIATNLRDMTPAEVERAMHEFMASQPGACAAEVPAETTPALA